VRKKQVSGQTPVTGLILRLPNVLPRFVARFLCNPFRGPHEVRSAMPTTWAIGCMTRALLCSLCSAPSRGSRPVKTGGGRWASRAFERSTTQHACRCLSAVASDSCHQLLHAPVYPVVQG
jgi:hypothetical protein